MTKHYRAPQILFKTLAYRYSELENRTIERIAGEANTLFEPGVTKFWATKTELALKVKAFAQANGFTVALHGKSWFCSKAKEPTSQAKRRMESNMPSHKKRKVTSKRCGCDFVIKFTEAPCKITGAPPGSVRVTEGSQFMHSNGCRPGRSQLRNGNITSGNYTRMALADSKVKILFDLMRNTDDPVKAKVFRDILRPVLPEGVPVTSKFIANLRHKILMIIRKERDSNAYFDEKDAVTDYLLSNPSEEQMTSMDEFPVDYLDQASRDARKVLHHALKESTDAARIEKLFQDLHKKDSGFHYNISYDKDNNPTSYSWQTPWQRAAFEQYGDVIFLDCMKRQQNSVDWPYIGPVVLDGDNNIIVVIESICISERLEAYQNILERAFEFTPGRPRESVKVIFGDGIMSHKLLVNLGINNTCKLCLDAYHLLKVDWPRHFGIHLFQSLYANLQSLIYNNTEEEYFKHYETLKGRLVAMPSHLSYLDKEIHANRHKFSQCYVQKYEGEFFFICPISQPLLILLCLTFCFDFVVLTFSGNLKRRGDSPAEANHASFVRRIGPGSSEEPATAIVHMLERMEDMAAEQDHKLSLYNEKCVAQQKLLLEAGDFINADAIVSLSSEGYRLWREESSQAKFYSSKPCNSVNEDGIIEVRRVNTNGQPRLVGPSQRCDCLERVAMGVQCRHEICAFGYRLDLFGKRYYQRKGVLDGYFDPSKSAVVTGVSRQTDQPVSTVTAATSGLPKDSDSVTAINDQLIGENHDGTGFDDYAEGADGNDNGYDDDESAMSLGDEQSKLATFDINSENQPPLLRTDVARLPTKVDYKTFMNMSTEFWDLVRGRDDANKFFGALVQLMDIARNKGYEKSAPLEELTSKYLSCFSSHQSSCNLFSQTATNGVLARAPLARRSNNIKGRVRIRRMQPNVETQLRPATKKPPRCNFCKQVAHKISTCSLLHSLEAERLESDTAIQNMALYLGDPEVHHVRPMPTALSNGALKNINWQMMQVPSNAVHVLLVDAYLDPTRPGSGGRRCTIVPDAQENIIKAVLIGETGKPIDEAPQFFKAKFLRQWISRKAKRNLLLTKLQARKLKSSDDYEYGN